jgi:hypothetical protein
LPEDYELIAFFEAEPEILDPSVPWVHNTLTFTTVRGGIEVCCKISPSYGRIILSRKLAGEDILNIAVERMIDIRLESRDSKEIMLVSDGRGNELLLQLKPRVRVGWRNRE